MFKSFIDPTKIIGDTKKLVSPEAFSNFMSGGTSPIGSSVLNSAVNNISNFSRGGVEIKSDSNFAPIISNISTNIVNNIDNSISNTLNSFKTEIQNVIGGLQKQVQSSLSSVIEGFTKDYQNRLQEKDESSSSNILKNLLGLYKNAVEFVTFFGDSKNNRRIESSLKSLRSLFDESFNAAVVIRQTINKIVKQLSNLPTASPTSGALNLDINVPGGPLKQSGQRATGGVFAGGRGKALAVGAVGVAGVGLLGMKSAQARQDEKLAETAKKPGDEDSVFNDFIDGLNGIIERFSEAVESLLGGGKNKSGSSGASSSGSSSPSGEVSGFPGIAGPSQYSPGTIPENVKADTEFTSGVTELAKKYDVPEDYLYAVMGFETGGTYNPSEPNRMESGATGLIQFTPRTARDLGTSTSELSRMTRAQQLKYVDKYFSDKGIKGASLDDLYMSILFPAAIGKPSNFVLFGKGAMPGYTGEAYEGNRGLDINGNGSITKEEAAKKVHEYLPKNRTPNPVTPPPSPIAPQTPKVKPAPPKDVSSVYQPPGSSNSSQVSFASLPPDVTVIPGEESSSGGVRSLALTGGESSAPDVAMYSATTDPENPYWANSIALKIINIV